MAGWVNDWYIGDDGKPDWNITNGPERYKPGSPFGPGGQYATQDPLNPNAWYADDPNTVGGMVHFDSSGNVLNTFSHGDARNDPRAEGGTGWNLNQLDAQGNPTQEYYPQEEGGLFGLGPGWSALAGVGLVMAAGFGIAGAASALGIAPGVIGVGGMGAGEAAAAGAGAALPWSGSGLLTGAAGEAGLGTGLETFAAGALPAAGGAGGGVGAGTAAGTAAGTGGGLATQYGAAIGPNLVGAAGAPALAGGGAGGGGLLGSLGLGNLGQYAPLIAAGTQGLGSIVGSTIAGNAATQAAQIQADAARAANNTQLAIYEQNRADLAPYRAAGYGALQQLGTLVDQPVTLPSYTAYPTLQAGDYAFNTDQYAFHGPDLSEAQYGFTPPSGQQVLTDDPGYQFRVSEGLKALDRQASARGSLVSGGQLKATQQYAQDLASQEYGASYERALGRNQLRYGRAVDTYNRQLAENQLGYERGLTGNQLAYGRAQTQNTTEAERRLQAQQANAQQTLGLRNMRYNELAGLSGTGQTAAATTAEIGSRFVGPSIAGNITSAGAAQAAGQVGAANALSGGLQGVGNAASGYLNYALLSQYLNQNRR